MKKTEEKTPRSKVVIWVDTELKNRLQKLSDNGMNMSHIVREGLELILPKYEKKFNE